MPDWAIGRRLRAADTGAATIAIETTLDEHTIANLIARACASHEVTMWFVGLDAPEHRIACVRARGSVGGHAIPPRKIRECGNSSRANLVTLLSRLHELFVYDNSAQDIRAERAAPACLLNTRNGRIVGPRLRQSPRTPNWAKPIVATTRQPNNPANSRHQQQ